MTKSPHGGTRMKRVKHSAFTLVELLVVMLAP
jgi:hypothetical protein